MAAKAKAEIKNFELSDFFTMAAIEKGKKLPLMHCWACCHIHDSISLYDRRADQPLRDRQGIE